MLPSLAKEFVNPAMIPFVLPNTMLIAENSSKEEYVEHILPLISPVMKIQEPVQVSGALRPLGRGGPCFRSGHLTAVWAVFLPSWLGVNFVCAMSQSVGC